MYVFGSNLQNVESYMGRSQWSIKVLNEQIKFFPSSPQNPLYFPYCFSQCLRTCALIKSEWKAAGNLLSPSQLMIIPSPQMLGGKVCSSIIPNQVIMALWIYPFLPLSDHISINILHVFHRLHPLFL